MKAEFTKAQERVSLVISNTLKDKGYEVEVTRMDWGKIEVYGKKADRGTVQVFVGVRGGLSVRTLYTWSTKVVKSSSLGSL